MSETTERVAIHDNEILEIKSEIKDIKSMPDNKTAYSKPSHNIEKFNSSS